MKKNDELTVEEWALLGIAAVAIILAVITAAMAVIN